MAADSLPFGVFGRAHGIRGEVVFRPHNPAGVALERLHFPFTATLRIDPRAPGGVQAPRSHPGSVRLLAARRFGEGALVRIDGISDRDAAAQLTNLELLVPRDVLPALGEGEYYIEDLIGCAVHDEAGRPRGVVTGAYWNGRQDVLEIRDAEGSELLIPAVPDFLREVDLVARRLVIDDHE